MNKQSFITILLAVLMSMTGGKASAYDICVKNADGQFICYSWKNNKTELEVTYDSDLYGNIFQNYRGNITIPEYVEYEGESYRVTSIGSRAFDDCYRVTSVIIPSSVTSIGSMAFSACDGLTSITISPGVTFIGDDAFHGCSTLTSITIPNSVTSIGSRVFIDCSSLTSIKVENDNHIYDSRNDCNGIIETATNTLIIGCMNTTIPNSVKSIDAHAFYGCTGLTSITIPNSVNSIGENAFLRCSGLTSIKVESGNKVYDSRKDCNAIIETSSNKLIAGCVNTVIPNSVTSIDAHAFYGCTGLTSVVIPNSVTSISTNAFFGCSGLTNVVSKIENPFEIGSAFYFYPNDIYATATLFVPVGKKSAYEAKGGWNSFINIKEIIDGDVDLDEKMNRNDQNALVAYIMGEKLERFYEGLADLNGDDDVNAADVVTLVNILNNGGLSTDSQFDFDNVDGSLVVSSLICTLNNKRNETIQLTKCELYCKGNLVSYKNFSDSSLTAGGSKECSFNNLTKHAAGNTDFIVCWHYTVNGEAFVYRCPMTD
ncbi:MAG: leucine-rich repeat protein [Prevotella sp.]|nr:leucine-rich repeat protein [Prevotella sp.]